MNSTKRHIAYLLESRGFVEIPGMGTLSLHRTAASFDGTRLLPPSEVVSFDASPENASCVALQHSVMKADGLDSERAFAAVSEGAGVLRREIEREGSAVIPGVGTLTSESGTLTVVPEAHGMFGYPQIDLLPLKKETTAPQASPLADEGYRKEAFLRSLHRTASAAAAIAVFVLVAFIVSQIPGRRIAANQASFSFDSASAPVTALATTEPAAASDASLILVFNTPADASCPVVYESEPEELSTSPARYCLVVASLANENEASRYLAGAPEGLRLLEKDGRYRVYALEAATAEDLLAKAQEADIYKTYPSAWICRK